MRIWQGISSMNCSRREARPTGDIIALIQPAPEHLPLQMERILCRFFFGSFPDLHGTDAGNAASSADLTQKSSAGANIPGAFRICPFIAYV
jgi:hypothetical protein